MKGSASAKAAQEDGTAKASRIEGLVAVGTADAEGPVSLTKAEADIARFFESEDSDDDAGPVAAHFAGRL